MALTKVSTIGIATGISLTGVTTTQDAKVGTGITLSPDGDGYYTGIITATSYRGDVSNCTGVGQTNFIDAESLSVSGISTLTGQATVGTGITLSPDGDVFFTGVVTATSYAGDGSSLTGIAATDNVRTGILDVAGVGTFRDNINIADRIIHVGDTNCSIRFPTADTFTVETNGTERIRVDSGGRLLIATTDIEPVSDGEVPKLIIKSTASDAAAAFVRHSADAGGSGIYIGKSRNATIGSNTIVQDDDELGRITFSGDDGTNINTIAGRIQAFVDGTPGVNDMPGRLVFSTTADGASSVTERMRIDSAGRIGFGGLDPASYYSTYDDFVWGATSGSVGMTIVSANDGAGYISWADGTSGSAAYAGRLFYAHSNNSFNFRVNESATNAITIDSSSRLLVGHNQTLSEGCSFQVARANDNTVELFCYSANANGARINLTKSRNGTIGTNTVVQDGDTIGEIHFRAADGSGYFRTAAIEAEIDGTPGTNDVPGRLIFSTTADGANSQSERMRIDSSGRVIIARSGSAGALNGNDAALHVTAPTDGGQGGIYIHCNSQSAGTVAAHYGLKIDAVNCANNANPQCGAIINVVQQYTASETGIKLSVEGSYNTTTGYSAAVTKNLAAVTNAYAYYSALTTTNSGGSAYHFRGDDDGSVAIYILENGNIQNVNNSYGSTSDIKLKENIVDAKSQWADIKAVKVRNFNFKKDPDTKLLGVVAQEIETVSAGLVHAENDIEVNEETGEGTITGTTKSVKYSILYMKAIKCLQEAQTRIEALETKVAALESA